MPKGEKDHCLRGLCVGHGLLLSGLRLGLDTCGLGLDLGDCGSTPDPAGLIFVYFAP